MVFDVNLSSDQAFCRRGIVCFHSKIADIQDSQITQDGARRSDWDAVLSNGLEQLFVFSCLCDNQILTCCRYEMTTKIISNYGDKAVHEELRELFHAQQFVMSGSQIQF